MIFSHEWVQIGDGTIEAVRLRDDLSAPQGKPATLFRASEAPWCRAVKPGKYVTDGPWPYRLRNGTLLLLWSSFSAGGYTVGVARSASGTIRGPWHHDPVPLYEGGGHCMIFHTLDGKPMLVLHGPNRSPDERARLFRVHETAESIRIEPYVWK